MEIPAFALEMLERLHRAGYPAYLTGGCVRDAVLDKQPHDYDISTAASPEKIAAVFGEKNCEAYGRAFGTMGVKYAGGFAEITTFRTEGCYSDRRHPSEVHFTGDVLEDLARRDFTWNAMAYSPAEGLLDPFGGQNDLEQGILRCVGVPQARFREDALRILRGMRFMARLGFAAEPLTDAAMRAEAWGLREISAERIFSELRDMLMGAHITPVLQAYPHILAVPIPEISPCIGFSQHSQHHDFTVWEHMTASVGKAVPVLPVRLTMLLHDIGKPACFTMEGMVGHFKGHAEQSAVLADRILRRLRCDNALREQTVQLIRHHRDIPVTLPAVRRLLGRMGEAQFALYLEVLQADHLSKKRGEPEVDPRPGMAAELAEKCRREALCCRVHDLALRGGDLAAMGYHGKTIGEAQRLLLAAVMDEKCENTAEALKRYLQNYYS